MSRRAADQTDFAANLVRACLRVLMLSTRKAGGQRERQRFRDQWTGLARPRRTMAAIGLTCAIAFHGATTAQAEVPVDLELILAVDVSLSMDHDEQKLQRDGYVTALRDPAVIQAIRSGPLGRIALTYVEWAGSHLQQVTIPWQLISSESEAHAFADALAAKPIGRARMTSISRAIRTSTQLFGSNGFAGHRRVIDVSGDGPNNGGGPVVEARDAAIRAGIVINGLAIQIKRGMGLYSYFDIPDLDKYYAACVIGGTGSFVLPIRTKGEFATAIRQKLLLEIAGLTPTPPARQRADQPRIQKAQFKLTVPKPSYDCLIGEKMWNRYMQDRWE